MCAGCVINWGSVADWVSGLGTMAAVIVGVVQWNLDRKKSLTQQERAQAGKVCHWVAKSKPSAVSGNLVLRNGSDLPISDVYIRYRHLFGNVLSRDGKDRERSQAIAKVGPDAQFEAVSGEVREDSVTLTFRDSAGVYWQRAADDTLTKLHGKPADPPKE